jgi:hypothetical protein
MEPLRTREEYRWAVLALAFTLAWAGCGDNGTGAEEDQTGATLQGQIIQFGAAANQDVALWVAGSAGPVLQAAFAPVSGVTVTVGNKSTETDGNGYFTITNMPLGNPTAVFSGSGITGPYTVNRVEENANFQMNGVQVINGTVMTEHTGTWIGTAGSTDPGSQGQIAFTLIIAANGNALSGSGSVAPPDNSIWSMSGIENGTSVDGEMTLVSSNSSCAAGATFTGTFSADTLSGTFLEVSPPAGCGSPESGTFRVVKQ